MMWLGLMIGGIITFAACLWVHRIIEYGRENGIVEEDKEKQ